MPEGPEVKRLVDQLQEVVIEEELLEVRPLTGRYTKNPIPGIDTISLPTIVKDINCKGKFIYWEFNNKQVAFTTLGMTGTWKTEPNKYARVLFRFKDLDLFYCDMRNFGTIKFTKEDELVKKLRSIGPDMLNNPCSLEQFLDILKHNENKNVCVFLMDQAKISGIGNIYKSESLYLSKINPLSKISDIKLEKRISLYYSILKVLRNSYELGGSTIRNYSDMFNNEGKYTRFASTTQEIVDARNKTTFNHAQDTEETMSGIMVYGQSVDPFGNPVVKAKFGDGRSTFYVPEVQQ